MWNRKARQDKTFQNLANKAMAGNLQKSCAHYQISLYFMINDVLDRVGI